MLTLGKTTLGTGGGNSLINNLGVTIRCDGFLCKECRITNRAMLTLCKTTLGTGGSNRLVNNLGMTLGVDGYLCNYYRVTNRAMLTLGKTTLGTGGSNSLVNNLGVVKVGNVFTLLLTAIAITHLYTVLGTGGILGNRPFAEAMSMFGSGILIISLITSNKAHQDCNTKY